MEEGAVAEFEDITYAVADGALLHA